MKSKLLAGALSAVFVLSAMPANVARADEGMFMMDQVAKLPLAQKGLKIKPNEIYNTNGDGISVAVPRLSIGCSSEFVSPDGLILTNHHCGIDALVAASTVQNNYGETGYKANSRADELPAKGYSIDITLREQDVTAQVLNGVDRDNAEAVAKRVEEITAQEQAKMGGDTRVQIQALNTGLVYYLFAYQTIKDIRVVYAPPYSIGQFGGDPDNFEWTRHGGDFTFLRAYVGKDGKAADYSKDNVPFKPKRFLNVSTAGLRPNDLTMIIGYPGGTNRFRESYSIAYNQDVQLPFQVDFLYARQASLEAAGRDNEAKRVALQAQVFEIANSRKAFEGGVASMRRFNLVAQRQAEEAKLQQYIAADPARQAKYGQALTTLKAAYENYEKTAPQDLVLRSMLQIAPIGFSFGALSGLADKNDLKEGVSEVVKTEPVANREDFKFLLRKAAELPSNLKIAPIEKRFGNLQGADRVRAEDEFARRAFENPTFTTEAGLNNLINQSAAQLRASDNPLLQLVAELGPSIATASINQRGFNGKIAPNRRLYVEALTAMRNSTFAYPDANFTQRFTFGVVEGYKPREAVTYTPFTTLDGVFEKDTGRAPFNSPAKLRDLYRRKDYGQYAVNGSVPVDFLSTNDIIGGNSGSPVLNADGELVGIAFDGNYEGLGNDFFYPPLQRTISVDIRYVLFITDKFGDAGWIFKEMNIKNGSRANSATAAK